VRGGVLGDDYDADEVVDDDDNDDDDDDVEEEEEDASSVGESVEYKDADGVPQARMAT
jgi:hypothetical protein